MTERDTLAAQILARWAEPGIPDTRRRLLVRWAFEYANDFEMGRLVLADQNEEGNRPVLEPSMPDAGLNLRAEIAALERHYTILAIRRCEGNISQAARLLQINRTTLMDLMSRQGIDANVVPLRGLRRVPVSTQFVKAG